MGTCMSMGVLGCRSLPLLASSEMRAWAHTGVCEISHTALLEVSGKTAAARAPQAIALERLKAKLVVLAEERQLAEVAELRGDAVKAEWGQQARPARPASLTRASDRRQACAHVGSLHVRARAWGSQRQMRAACSRPAPGARLAESTHGASPLAMRHGACNSRSTKLFTCRADTVLMSVDGEHAEAVRLAESWRTKHCKWRP